MTSRPRFLRRKRRASDRFDRAATSGVLWALAAVLLWTTQRRDARRAGLRGLVNASIAWIATTLFARYVGENHRAPAVAAAFSTGAALEAPLTGAPAVAATAATLRGRKSADVAAAALGAGIAIATRRVWPVPPRHGPAAPKVDLEDLLGPGGDGLYIVVNIDAGNGSPIEDLKDALPQAKIDEIDIVEGNELRKALDEAAEYAAVLGISGGDGSINTAAQVALDHDKPLVVFPSGTLNHLTGGLGIDTIDESLDAVRKGQAIQMDVGTIDEHVFVNTASFGAYVELVDMRERLEKRLGKWPAVVIALVRVLRKSDPVCIEIEGRQAKVWMAFIGNCRYSPSGFAPSWRKRLDDCKIDFRYVDGTTPWARLRLVAAVLTGRLGRCKVYKQTVVDELRIRSLEGPLRLARDGETFEAASKEFVVRKLPARLTIYCPHGNVA